MCEEGLIEDLLPRGGDYLCVGGLGDLVIAHHSRRRYPQVCSDRAHMEKRMFACFLFCHCWTLLQQLRAECSSPWPDACPVLCQAVSLFWLFEAHIAFQILSLANSALQLRVWIWLNPLDLLTSSTYLGRAGLRVKVGG